MASSCEYVAVINIFHLMDACGGVLVALFNLFLGDKSVQVVSCRSFSIGLEKYPKSRARSVRGVTIILGLCL